jgi:membrane protein DedA with SNARE-associated domain
MGYAGVAILMALENVVLPLPSEVIMPLAGFSADQGHMSLWGAIVAGSIGSVVGAIPVYYFAHTLGEERIGKWVEKYGRWMLLSAKDLKKADKRFRDHGARAVFLSQLVPGVRGLISLPAGWARMNVLLFALMNFLGTIIWCTVLTVLGDILGANYEKVHEFLGPVKYMIFGLAILGIGVWIWRRRTQH